MTYAYIFWVATALVLYAYAFYPLLMAIAARLIGRPINHSGHFQGSVSIVVAAYNEEKTIARRVRELCGLIRAANLPAEMIVVSDGSTDQTAQIARQQESDFLRVIEQTANMGKAAALNAGVAGAKGDIIIFGDSRQRWADDVLEKLLRNFSDASVGAVGGQLICESAPGVMAGVGLYWKYEKWLRKQESAVHSTVGLSGSISAVRRELFTPLPEGINLDDVCWPMHVTRSGFRVVHEEEAIAFDRLPERARDEFRRKVRTLSGNFQLALRCPWVLLPFLNPIWFQFLSHKMLRLAVPWALLAMLISSAMAQGNFYRAALVAQILFYVLAIIGIRGKAKVRLAGAAGSFLVLNTAAWVGFWIWISGRSGRSWSKVAYSRGTV